MREVEQIELVPADQPFAYYGPGGVIVLPEGLAKLELGYDCEPPTEIPSIG